LLNLIDFLGDIHWETARYNYNYRYDIIWVIG